MEVTSTTMQSGQALRIFGPDGGTGITLFRHVGSDETVVSIATDAGCVELHVKPSGVRLALAPVGSSPHVGPLGWQEAYRAIVGAVAEDKASA